jgi:hypothetical protein
MARLDRKWVRWFLFVGGTLLTAMLAFITITFQLIPDKIEHAPFGTFANDNRT